MRRDAYRNTFYDMPKSYITILDMPFTHIYRYHLLNHLLLRFSILDQVPEGILHLNEDMFASLQAEPKKQDPKKGLLGLFGVVPPSKWPKWLINGGYSLLTNWDDSPRFIHQKLR